MGRMLVAYYSNKGSNEFLAVKTAGTLDCDIEKIRPRLNIFLLLLMNISLGIKPFHLKPKDYDAIILCGPVWIGRFVSPLKDFVRKYGKDIRKLYFMTCCGSSDKMKMEKFGHGHVFNMVKDMLGERCVHCEAFPIALVLPDEMKEDGEAVMQTRLSEANFTGEIQKRFNEFIGRVKIDQK